eukprot:902400-Prorocentrum_minimum.AAC.1
MDHLTWHARGDIFESRMWKKPHRARAKKKRRRSPGLGFQPRIPPPTYRYSSTGPCIVADITGYHLQYPGSGSGSPRIPPPDPTPGSHPQIRLSIR